MKLLFTRFIWLVPLLVPSFLFAQETQLNDLNAKLFKLYGQGKFSEALEVADQALKFAEQSFGPDDPKVAAALSNVASIDKDLSRFAEAEPLFKRAIAINEKALGPNHPDLASCLGNLAELYEDQSRFAEAEPLFQRALSIDEKALGPEHPHVATDLNDLAHLYKTEGKYTQAEPFFTRALNIREKALGPNSPEVGRSLINLAEFYDTLGKSADAEPLYLRAIHILKQALGPEHPNVAVALTNLAMLYFHQGRYSEAEQLFLESYAINEKVYGPDSPNAAGAINSLASLYFYENKYDLAEPLYRTAIKILEKTYGPDDPAITTEIQNLAQLYTQVNKFADAEPLALRALHIDEKTLGPDNPSIAIDLNSLALLYTAEGKYEDAIPLYNRTLAILQKSLGPNHSSVALTLFNLAVANDDLGRFREAEPFYQQAFESLFQQLQYNFTYMTEKERLGLLSTVAEDFPAFFSFVHRYRQQDPSLTGSMYNLLLLQKGFVAGSIADIRRQVQASGDPEALALLDRLTAKRTQIAALLSTVPSKADLAQVEQLRSEANDIERSLVARSSTFAERKTLDRATWQQVRDALKPGEAAVEFARFNLYDKKRTNTTYYAALIVTPETKDTPQYIFLGDSKKIEGEALTRFTHSVQTRAFLPQADTQLPGAAAYQLIWKPIEDSLAKSRARVTRIYLSPDGALNQIPIGIIPAPTGKLAMEIYDIRLVNTTRDLLRTTPSPTASTALLVGDPIFDLTENQQRAAVEMLALPQTQQPSRPSTTPASTQLSRDQPSGSKLPRLPGTGAEVNAIALLMKKRQWNPIIYTGDLALKTAVEQAASPSVVHLATHGFFLADQQSSAASRPAASPAPSEDPMLRSGLYFAGADRTLAGKPTPPGLDNGVLTALEAANLNLHGTKLVVLSACNTGQGEVINGEGVFGLRRALQEAGAQSILMSLWSVPDKETLDLMKLFYSKWLAGTEIHIALKQAQLEIRAQVRKSHNGKDLPYYWGAFVLVGR